MRRFCFCLIALALVIGVPGRANAGVIFFSELITDEIRTVQDDGSGLATIITGENANALALDLINDKIYWVDSNDDTVSRANLDGTGTQDLVTLAAGLNVFGGIALDVAANHMYYSEIIGNTIRRADLDGTNQATILSGEDASGLALDLINGKIYWTDNDNDAVKRANLDGTAVETLFTFGGGINILGAITLDVSGNQMFFAETFSAEILSTALNGSGVATVATTQASGLALDPTGNKLYWSDLTTDQIRRSNFDGTSDETIHTPGGGIVSIGDLALDFRAPPPPPPPGVSEPATLAIFVLGLAGLGLMRRRKRVAA